MDKVVKAVKPEEVTRIEEAQQEAAKPAPAPAKIVGGTKPREKEVPLDFPVEYDGVLYESLTVRRVKGSDFRRFAELGGSSDEELMIVSIMTGAPKEVVAALDGDDFLAVQEVVQDFLPHKMRAAAEQLSKTGQNTSAS